jgi:hypothetical protein
VTRGRRGDRRLAATAALVTLVLLLRLASAAPGPHREGRTAAEAAGAALELGDTGAAIVGGGAFGAWWRQALLTDDFATPNGPNGLIANEYAFWNPRAMAVRSPVWQLTSGSLFSRGGHGWTGPPDLVVPAADSSNGTNSRVFRLRTRRADFGSVRMEVWVRVDGFTPRSRGGRAWDGVVLWPRYRSERTLYFAYLERRDGVVQLTKKCPGRRRGGNYFNGGTYFSLTPARSTSRPRRGRWHRLAAEVRDHADGSVTVRAYRDGELVASVRDRGRGCPPIHGPARVGIRGDNAEFSLDDFRVMGIGRGGA